MKEVKSSNIHSIDYQNGTLMIRFRDRKTGGPGNLYHYPDVPAHIHGQLMEADSHGKFFLSSIRDQYRGVKQ